MFLSIIPLPARAEETTPEPADHIVINEVFVNPQGIDTGYEWIELYNPTDSDINIAGWSIESAGTTFIETFVWPEDEYILQSGEYIVIGEEFVPEATITAAIQLQNGGSATDGVRLVNNTNEIVDTILYDTPNTNALASDDSLNLNPAEQPNERESLARIPNGVDTNDSSNDVQRTTLVTPGTLNQTPVSTPTPTPTPSQTPTPRPTPQPTPQTTPTPAPTATPTPSDTNQTQNESGDGSSREQARTGSLAVIRTQTLGTWIQATGTVTAAPGTFYENEFYIQDTTAGILVDGGNKDIPQIQIGDTVQLVGKLSESAGQRKINLQDANDITVTGTATSTAVPVSTIAELGETYEGQLITINGTVEKQGSSISISDNTGSMKISIKKATNISTSDLKDGDTLTIAGILAQEGDEYKLLPRTQTDLAYTENTTSRTDNNTATTLPKTGPIWHLGALLASLQTGATFVLLYTKREVTHTKTLKRRILWQKTKAYLQRTETPPSH